MIILGLVLLVIGLIVPIPILTTIGGIVLIVGIILIVLGGAGHPIGGRRYWY